MTEKTSKLTRTIGFFCITLLLMSGCSGDEWSPSGSILLNDITPIGAVMMADFIWVADGDNNRIVLIDQEGNLQQSIEGIERPMHLDAYDGVIYVPSYGIDEILVINNNQIDTLESPDDLEAPAAISVSGNNYAIADFYNNRVVVRRGDEWQSIGQKGKGDLEFSYPTDVQFYNNKIYVADAYNHRIQVLNQDGQHLMNIGEAEKMNAATGIFVTEREIMITDFENDRVLFFNHDGTLRQIIDKGLNKPTDLFVTGNRLYVTNYKGRYISIYQRG